MTLGIAAAVATAGVLVFMAWRGGRSRNRTSPVATLVQARESVLDTRATMLFHRVEQEPQTEELMAALRRASDLVGTHVDVRTIRGACEGTIAQSKALRHDVLKRLQQALRAELGLHSVAVNTGNRFVSRLLTMRERAEMALLKMKADFLVLHDRFSDHLVESDELEAVERDLGYALRLRVVEDWEAVLYLCQRNEGAFGLLKLTEFEKPDFRQAIAC